MSAASAATSAKHTVARLQVIYFLIALGGIATALSSLFLSHRAIDAFAADMKQHDNSRIIRQQANTHQIVELRRYEYLLGGMLLLIVSCAGYYGIYIGRVMRGKLEELAKVHRDLEESHEQALAFAREIQAVNQDMGRLNVELSQNITKLREAQDEALRKGKMAQLGHLTATVAHELRNPLSVVRTTAFLLGRKTRASGIDAEVQLQRINAGIVRCDNIITQLLDFSRSRAVRLELIALDEWLEKIVESEAPKLPDLLAIDCRFGLPQTYVNIEPGRFERAIINLLHNASEALLGRGDDPKMRYRPDPLITITTRLSSRGAEIAVADNGPGMSAETLAKIHEPLFTTKNFGTGLGIPAVEQILEQHGGGLEAVSTIGAGACFTIWLPTAQHSLAHLVA